MITRCFAILLLAVFAAPSTSTKVYTGWPFDAKEAVRRQTDTAKALGVPKQLTVDLGGGISLKLILIPAGEFMMGSPETEMGTVGTAGHRANESPLHKVTITRPFYMSIYKITQEQYKQIMGANPSEFWGKTSPVDAVTWNQAALFCQKASANTKRIIHLPTEAQWEYSARAGTSTRYFFGDDESKLGDYSWYYYNSELMTHVVGYKPPNAWGLYDVHGLLWEYASDFYADSYADAKGTDPVGPDSGTTHTARGRDLGKPSTIRAFRYPNSQPCCDCGLGRSEPFRVPCRYDVGSVP